MKHAILDIARRHLGWFRLSTMLLVGIGVSLIWVSRGPFKGTPAESGGVKVQKADLTSPVPSQTHLTTEALPPRRVIALAQRGGRGGGGRGGGGFGGGGGGGGGFGGGGGGLGGGGGGLGGGGGGLGGGGGGFGGGGGGVWISPRIQLKDDTSGNLEAKRTEATSKAPAKGKFSSE